MQGIFAIDLCVYAVRSNHYHVVLHIGVEQALAWTEKEVIERWHRLFKGALVTQRCLEGASLGLAERPTVSELARQWRGRLMDIS